MAHPQHLYVFCYDIHKRADRDRVVGVLEQHLVRVQQSVFEGWLSHDAAKRLSEKTKNAAGADDNLRVYCLTKEGRERSIAFGGAPLPEAQEFWIV